jgi:hypothetical protein
MVSMILLRLRLSSRQSLLDASILSNTTHASNAFPLTLGDA